MLPRDELESRQVEKTPESGFPGFSTHSSLPSCGNSAEEAGLLSGEAFTQNSTLVGP